MVKNLPRMIRYLKDRRVYVLFNTNGTLLAPKNREELIDTGLDECASRSTPRMPRAFSGAWQAHV